MVLHTNIRCINAKSAILKITVYWWDIRYKWLTKWHKTQEKQQTTTAKNNRTKKQHTDTQYQTTCHETNNISINAICIGNGLDTEQQKCSNRTKWYKTTRKANKLLGGLFQKKSDTAPELTDDTYHFSTSQSTEGGTDGWKVKTPTTTKYNVGYIRQRWRLTKIADCRQKTRKTCHIHRHQTPPRCHIARIAIWYGPLRPNVTSSLKPEVHNISQRHQSRTDPQPQGISTQNFVNIGQAVPEICSRTDRHRQIDKLIAVLCSPGRSKNVG